MEILFIIYIKFTICRLSEIAIIYKLLFLFLMKLPKSLKMLKEIPVFIQIPIAIALICFVCFICFACLTAFSTIASSSYTITTQTEQTDQQATYKIGQKVTLGEYVVQVANLENPFDWTLSDSEGYNYQVNFFAPKNPELTSGNLNPTKIARGWVTFEVREDANQLTAQFDPSFWSADNIEIELF